MKRSKTTIYLRLSRQRGMGLVETLAAIAILGTAVVAFTTGLATGSIAVGEHDGQATAQGLAQSQMEYTKSYAYNPGATDYPLLAAPEGYSLDVNVGAAPGGDADIQRITITVSRGGEEIITVEDYKVNR